MFEKVYYLLLKDLRDKNENSVIYRHHIAYIKNSLKYYRDINYLDEEENQVVVDYIASMTDDYFIELYKELFPESGELIEYKSYFDSRK